MELKSEIEVNQFFGADIRVGTVVEAKPFPEAKKPAYQLVIDFGDLGMRKSSAQITAYYTPESLVGKQIVALINIPNRQIGPFMSECLVLGGVQTNGNVVLLQPERTVANGTHVA